MESKRGVSWLQAAGFVVVLAAGSPAAAVDLEPAPSLCRAYATDPGLPTYHIMGAMNGLPKKFPSQVVTTWVWWAVVIRPLARLVYRFGESELDFFFFF